MENGLDFFCVQQVQHERASEVSADEIEAGDVGLWGFAVKSEEAKPRVRLDMFRGDPGSNTFAPVG